MTQPIDHPSPTLSLEQQLQSPMQALTLDEMRAVVGGPVIENGGIVGVAAATPNKD